MTPRLHVPGLGIDQIISPRVSDETEKVTVQVSSEPSEPSEPDDPANIPDVADELIHLLAEGHTALDADGSFLGVDLAAEEAEGDLDLPLGPDPDTAMVESVYLHLLSEHGRLDALHLNEEEALVLHDNLHVQAQLEDIEDHNAKDLRFRHKRAMAAAMRCAEMDSEADPAVIIPTNV